MEPNEQKANEIMDEKTNYLYSRNPNKTEFVIPLKLPNGVTVYRNCELVEDDGTFGLNMVFEYLKDLVGWLEYEYFAKDIEVENVNSREIHTQYFLTFPNAFIKFHNEPDSSGCICVRIKKVDFELEIKKL